MKIYIGDVFDCGGGQRYIVLARERGRAGEERTMLVVGLYRGPGELPATYAAWGRSLLAGRPRLANDVEAARQWWERIGRHNPGASEYEKHA
jgi:hypothetical protein